MLKRLILGMLTILLLVSGCVLHTSVETPSPGTNPVPDSTPKLVSTPSSTTPSIPNNEPTSIYAPTQEPSPAPGLPDLVWIGVPVVEPLAPIVGDQLHINQAWRNAGTATTPAGFEVSVKIIKGNASESEQFIKVPQNVKPGEVCTLDITTEYVFKEPGEYKVVLALDPKGVITESRKDNNNVESDTRQIPDLSDVPTFSKDPDTAAITQAAKDIEKYRKGDVTLTVVDSVGQPRSGVTVDYTQITHSFLFGVFSPSADEKVWSLMKEADINYAFLVFNWKDTEPESGRFNLGPKRTSLLSKYGLFGIGHCLIFLIPDMPWSTPDYIIRLSFDGYMKAVYAHFYEVVNAYKHEITIWNVFNEPMYQNMLNFTSKQTIEIIQEGIRGIRDADPKARILINIFNAGGEIPGVDQYGFLKEVVQSNATFDTIGLEFYYNAYMTDRLNPHPRRTLTGMAELIDKYSTFGKKIQITEISVPSKNEGSMQGYWNQPWSEELQAEYLKSAYTLFFSKPQVEGITWWDATDSTGPFIYHGALLDEQNKPKKSYYALKSLIRNWTTTGAVTTDDKGQVSFRGFGGTYEINVTDNKTGLSKKQVITVTEQQQNSITIVLN